jgi:hypothetical protein
MENQSKKRESVYYQGSINLSKVDKKRFFVTEKGNIYLNIELYVSDELDQYGNHITIAQARDKNDAESKRIYCGNAKLFEKKVDQAKVDKEIDDLFDAGQLGKSEQPQQIGKDGLPFF